MIQKCKILFEERNIHKLYIICALLFGTIFSLFMPLFNEPDGQYHLAVSGKVVHSIVDTSYYNEPKVDSGMVRQGKYYKADTHFEEYYLNKANFIKSNELPRNIRYSFFDFTFWGHIIPGIGMLLGKFIYPSLGVMITFARYVSTIINSVIIYFIIKKLKFGKMIYLLIFLSPVVLNSFASLSYDTTGYVCVAFFMMLVINTISRQKITKKDRIYFIISTLSILLGAKWNYWLLLLLWPILEYNYGSFFNNIKLKVNRLFNLIISSKRNFLVFIIPTLFILITFIYFLTRNHGGIFYVIQRFLMTFGYSYAGMNIHSNDITSWLAAPYPSQNYIPTWISSVWYLMFFLVIFSEKKFVKKQNIGWISLVFFFLGVFGVYYTMLGYNGARTSYIEGVQGRYFTPTLILIQIMASSLKSGLNRNARRIVPFYLIALVFVSNTLLIFDTIVGLIMR